MDNCNPTTFLEGKRKPCVCEQPSWFHIWSSLISSGRIAAKIVFVFHLPLSPPQSLALRKLMITLLAWGVASFRYFSRIIDVSIYQMQKAMSHYGFQSKAAKSDVLSSIINILSRVPVVMQWKWIRLGTTRLWVRSVATLSELRIRCCHELWCRSQTRLGSGIAVV